MKQLIVLSRIGFLVLFVFTRGWGQSVVKITGLVRDRTTHKPLYGANIVVEGTGLGTFSDECGRWVIENLFVGEYTITASYMGYESQTKSEVRVSLDCPVQIDFQLLPEVIELPGITVTASRIPDEQTASVVVITAEDIKRSNAQNLGEILQQVPGVEIQDKGGEKTVSIRGSCPNQVLVLLEGIRLNDAMIGQVDLANIPLGMVERVEVIKGGSSAHFGAGAIGGVINITSRKPSQSQISLEGGVGAFGRSGCAPTLSGSLRKLGYFVSFEHQKSEGDYPFSYERSDGTLIKEDRINADFFSNCGFGKCNYQGGSYEFELHGYRFRSKRGLPGLIFGLTPYARAKTDRDILGGHCGTHWRWVGVDIHLSYHKAITEYKHIYPPDTPLRYRTVLQYHSKSYLTNYQISLKGRVFLKRLRALRFGYEGNWAHYADEDLIQPSNKPIGETRDFTHGIYLYDELKFPFPIGFKQGLLTSALRYDQIRIKNKETSRYERQWSPKLGLLLWRGKLNRIGLKANLDRSFRPPTFADLFYQEYRVKGKPDLKPERSRSSEIGLSIDWHIWGELRGEITHFYNKVDDLISWRLGSFATFSPFNTDAEISGEEYGLTWHSPNDIFSLHWNQTHLKPINKSGERTTHNKDLPYRPRRTAKIGVDLNYRIFQLQYQRRVIGKRFVTEANTVEMPGYGVDDLTVGAKPRIKGVDVQIRGSIYNLGNVKYEMVERAPLPPREWRIGLTLKRTLRCD
jgi:vitamin B12 transporter